MNERSIYYAGFITLGFASSRFFTDLNAIFRAKPRIAFGFSEAQMAFTADHTILLDRLDEVLRVAVRPTRDIFAKIIAGVCTRIPAVSLRDTRIDRLIAAGAWTEAAFTLIEREDPAWTLRRLAFDDGEWFCSLSRQPFVPAALDDTADANHASMAIAILLAFLEARRRGAIVSPNVTSVPAVQSALPNMVCCENFA